jgi:hypothetical protein
MRHRSQLTVQLRLLPFALVPLLACAGGTDAHESSAQATGPLPSLAASLSTTTSVAPLQQRAAAPGRAARVSVEAKPSASCLLHAEADTQAESALKLFSDKQGSVSFYVERSPTRGSQERLLLDCRASDGRSGSYPIEITSQLNTRAAVGRRAAVAPLGRRRPALEGDLTRLTQAELQAGLYPLRPDPARSPQAYAQWLASVSHEATILEPEVAEVPGVSHDLQVIEGENWAAMIADNGVAGGQFTEIIGAWMVPPITATPSQSTYSSAWVGLDGGAGSSWSILQNGTAHNAQDWSAWLGFPYVVSEYYAWAQYLPGPSQRMTNFAIAPGDVVLIGTWVGNSSCGGDPNGGYACYYFENGTSHQVMTYSIAKPPGAHAFIGNSAEWVVERQLIGGNLPPLANFGAIAMPIAMATNTSWGVGGYADFGNLTAVDMYNFNQLLAWPSMSTSNPIEIDFHWVASQ